MSIKKGDLVACYLMDSDSMQESLLEYGIVLEVNGSLGDVFVVDQTGNARWWPQRRWRILSSVDNKEK